MLRTIAWRLVAVLWLGIGPFITSAEENMALYDCGNYCESQAGQSPKKPLFVETISRPRSADEIKEREEEAVIKNEELSLTKSLARDTNRLFWATVFLAVITGVLAAVAYFQIREGRRAIAAAEISARAAVQQAQTTYQLYALDKRAFIYPFSVVGQYEWDKSLKNFTWRLRVVIRNSGDTETKMFRVGVDCIMTDRAIPHGTPLPEIKTESREGFIPPRSDIYSGVAPHEDKLAITVDDIAEIHMGKRFCYLYGRMIYFDVFPDTYLHVAEFFWLIEFHGDGTYKKSSVLSGNVVPKPMSFTYIQQEGANKTYDEDRFTKENDLHAKESEEA